MAGEGEVQGGCPPQESAVEKKAKEVISDNLKPLTVPLDSVKLDPKNARKHPDKNLKAIKDSLKLYGQRKPIVVNSRTGIIEAGNGLYQAAKALGWKEIAVVSVDDDEAKAQAYAIMDNRSAELAEWDLPVLKDGLESLDDGSRDLEEWVGFTEKEIEDLMTQAHQPKDGLTDDDAVPEPKEAISKPGDLWILGDHRVLCGDSTKPEDVARLMNGERADCILTDPPYGIDLDTNYSKAPKGSARCALKGKEPKMRDFAPIQGDDRPFDASGILSSCGEAQKQFWFGADYYRRTLSNDDGDGSWLVWDKRSPETDVVIGSGFELIWSRQKHKGDLLRFYWNGVFGDPEARGRVHPTQKPTSLLVEILTRWTKDGQIVLDPFLGSGSTLIACEKLGRRCYGCEIEPHYVDVIVKRWEDYTGKKAVRG